MTRTLIAPLTESPDHQLETIAAAGERLLERVPEFHTINARQQAFLTEYVADFSASRAASAAGYSSKGGIARALYFIRQSAPIAACLKTLAAVVAARAAINIEGHLMQFAKLRDRALKLDQIGAAVRAEELRGKVGGLYVDRVALTSEQEMTDQELAREMARLSGITYEEALRRLISTRGSEN